MSDTDNETDIPPIPDDPVTDTYPLLAHLEDEDDSQRLQAFTQVLEEMRGELDRLPDLDKADRGEHGREHGRENGKDRR